MIEQVDEKQLVILGKVSGLYGVKGWVKIFSETQPRENVLQYSPWYLQLDGQWHRRELLQGKAHGKGVVALVEGCADRDVAATLMGATIAVTRQQLPGLQQGEYYWADLVGLEVVNLQGVPLGTVDSLLETGANDVLVVKDRQENKERLIPFVQPQVVTSVELAEKRLTVDWDADF